MSWVVRTGGAAGVAVVLCLGSVGCPVEPAGSAQVAPATRVESGGVARAETAAKATAKATAERERAPVAGVAPQRVAGVCVSREEVLEASPGEVWSEVWDRGGRGLLPSGRSVACCAEQLRSQDVPLEALGLVLVALQRAVDAAGDGEVEGEAVERLRRDLAVVVRGREGLAAWVKPFVERVERLDRQGLAVGKAFLERVYVLWRLARDA